MKILVILILLSLITIHLDAQNVGINTINPQELLHLRSDSSRMALRLDGKKPPLEGFDYFTVIATPSSAQNAPAIANLPATPWTDLAHSKLITSDDNRLLGPFIGIAPDFSSLLVRFTLPSSIPANAIITDILINNELRRSGSSPATMLVDFFLSSDASFIGQSYSHYPPTDGGEVSFSVSIPHNLTPAILNSGQYYLLVNAQLLSNNLRRLEIDRLALDIQYKVPTSTTQNVNWSAGINQGEFRIANSGNLINKQYLAIDESGVTQLAGLKIAKNAGAGKVLTSNSEGKAHWAVVPQQDVLWINKEDTAFYANGPIQVNNNAPNAALIFNKGESRINNGINMIETDNRLLNVIIDSDNDQTNEQFNIYKDSTEILAQNPVVRFNLSGNDSWINGGGNVGIGTNTPMERLDINGALKIGNTANIPPQAGTIRWNPTKKDFEGYTGVKWLSLTTNSGFGDKLGNEQQSFNGLSSSSFGYNVDIYNNYSIVSDVDSVYFYEKINSEWIKVKSFHDNCSWLLSDISIHQDYACTTSDFNFLNIYHRNSSGVWTLQEIKVVPLITSADIYDDKIIVGSFTAAKVYKRTGTAWDLLTTLLPIGPLPASFGQATAIHEDYIIVGSPADLGNVGSAHIWKIDAGGNILNYQKISPVGLDSFSQFGYAVDIKGQYAIVGAHEDSGGSAFIYKRSGTEWNEEVSLPISDKVLSDKCGSSVKLNGASTKAIVGCPSSNNERVIVYERTNNTWSQESILTPSDSNANDDFGFSSSIHGNTILVGSPKHSNDFGKIYYFNKDE